jgi:small subunit ribosomal protein S21
VVRVDVNDNNVDQAIRSLKKKLNREGFFREIKKRRFFEKPSEKRRREAAEAVRRTRKAAARRSAR